jgi:hypothetical protein
MRENKRDSFAIQIVYSKSVKIKEKLQQRRLKRKKILKFFHAHRYFKKQKRREMYLFKRVRVWFRTTTIKI